jgi:hypothetical protein
MNAREVKEEKEGRTGERVVLIPLWLSLSLCFVVGLKERKDDDQNKKYIK